MDGFYDYNQIEILPSDQHKMEFIFPWGTFSYRKLPSSLKNVGMTFFTKLTKLICDLPRTTETTDPFDSLLDEILFLISMTGPCYGDIILYL